ncbi:HAD family phosphatase [Tamlana sp. 2201CG12-4]|uniref:HAD family hydrolase n=1 Tax=Tamlana sp. 2201CG12-4 TaxID=3112582 RepID=UPI002DB79C06|nr:HAD family phosphatase [Tamlana sp. 2201CG12-4]MEC3908456.1 HAD family phosphatase [Tamlana sp. 2201CG12-4]
MLKAVIFDMDGVIIDSEPMHNKAYHDMFDEVGIKVSTELYESFTGQSTINICKRLCDHFNLSESPETLVAIKRKHYKQFFDSNSDLGLIDGVLDLIKDYHHNGLTLVLASSAAMTSINQIFDRFDLNPYFIARLSGGDLKASKPHPEIFIKAAEASGFSKNECMVIEDSTNGIEAAKGAGIFCVGYDSFHSKNQDYSKADLVIKDFKEIAFNKISFFKTTTV